MSPRVRAHLALLTVALIYGANYIIAREVMVKGYLSPKAFIWLRVTGASLLFLFTDRLTLSSERIERKDLLLLAVCALFGVALNQLLFFMGLERTSPINASIIMITTPMLVLIFAALLLKERIRIIQVLGILIGGAGAAMLILSKGKIALDRGDTLGNVFILLNAMSYALYLVLVKRLMRKYRALTVIKGVFLTGWIYISLIAVPDLLDTAWSAMPGHIVASIGYVILFTTFLAYLLTAWAIKHLSSGVVGAYIYLQPVFATAFSYLFLSEVIHLNQLLSGVIIAIGVMLTGKRARH